MMVRNTSSGVELIYKNKLEAALYALMDHLEVENRYTEANAIRNNVLPLVRSMEGIKIDTDK